MFLIICSAILLAYPAYGSDTSYNCSFAKPCICNDGEPGSTNVFCEAYDDKFPTFTSANTIISSLSIQGNFTKIPKYAFNKLKGEIFDLYFVRKENFDEKLDIDDDAFSSQAIDSVSFVNFQRPMSIPKQLSKALRLTGLTFQNCRIETISNDSFVGFESLELLRILSSHLNTIDVAGFEGLQDSLELIDFEHNELQEIPIDAIHNLIGLESIVLQYNKIKRVENNSFPVNVMSVDLSNNPVSEIDQDAFRGVKNVIVFTANTCNLTEIPSDLFQGDFLNARTLSFENNHITKIVSGAFETVFKKMTDMPSLNDNPISVIEYGAFSGLVAVETASFRNLYELELININSFYTMYNLKMIIFEQCRKLKNIMFDDAAYIQPNLQLISVTYSDRIEFVDKKFQQWFDRSSKNMLDISNNVVTCSNETSWMKNYLLCTMHPQIKMENTICDGTRVNLDDYLISFGRDCD